MNTRRSLLLGGSTIALSAFAGCTDVIGGGHPGTEVDPENALTHANTAQDGPYHIQEARVILEEGEWMAIEFEIGGSPEMDLSVVAEDGAARVMFLPRREWEDRYRDSDRRPNPDLMIEYDDDDPALTRGEITEAPYHMLVVDNTSYLDFEPQGQVTAQVMIQWDITTE